MKQKEVTLCGKKVVLAYCYATEIAYKLLSDEDITQFGSEVIQNIQNEQMPDIKRSIYLILAAMNAYYDSQGQQSPVTDKELMYECTPNELGSALGTVIGLRADFYYVPKDEPTEEKTDDDKPEGEKEKNA